MSREKGASELDKSAHRIYDFATGNMIIKSPPHSGEREKRNDQHRTAGIH